MNICKTTDDFREYSVHHKQLCRLIKCNPKTIIKKQPFTNSDENFNVMIWNDNSKNANLPKGSILYHTSPVRNLTRINGKFRGTEGRLFPTQRVYFHVGKPGGRMGSASDDFVKHHPNLHYYVYSGDVSKAKIDNEIGGTAVYIETNTSLPVKEITKFKSSENDKKNEASTKPNTDNKNENKAEETKPTNTRKINKTKAVAAVSGATMIGGGLTTAHLNKKIKLNKKELDKINKMIDEINNTLKNKLLSNKNKEKYTTELKKLNLEKKKLEDLIKKDSKKIKASIAVTAGSGIVTAGSLIKDVKNKKKKGNR